MAAKNHEYTRNDASTTLIIAASAVVAILIIAAAAVIIAGITAGYRGMDYRALNSQDSYSMMSNGMMGQYGMMQMMRNSMMDDAVGSSGGMMRNGMMSSGMMGQGGMKGMMGNMSTEQANEMHEGCEKMMG